MRLLISLATQETLRGWIKILAGMDDTKEVSGFIQRIQSQITENMSSSDDD